MLPVDFDVTEKRTHDYVRHGTTNLFAALNTATGKVTADCYPRRTGEVFLRFLRKAVRPHRGKEIHVVLDHLSTHDTPEVRAWLERNPNVTFHFTPIGSSCLNQIESGSGSSPRVDPVDRHQLAELLAQSEICNASTIASPSRASIRDGRYGPRPRRGICLVTIRGVVGPTPGSLKFALGRCVIGHRYPTFLVNRFSSRTPNTWRPPARHR